MISSLEKDLIDKGLSQEEARELLARGLATKEAMGDQIQTLRAEQMVHPKGSASSRKGSTLKYPLPP